MISRFHFVLLIRKEPDTFHTLYFTQRAQTTSSSLQPTQIFSKCTQLCQVIPNHTSNNPVGVILNIDWVRVFNLQTDLWFLHKIIPTLFAWSLFTWKCPLIGLQKWNLSLKIHRRSNLSSTVSCHITGSRIEKEQLNELLQQNYSARETPTSFTQKSNLPKAYITPFHLLSNIMTREWWHLVPFLVTQYLKLPAKKKICIIQSQWMPLRKYTFFKRYDGLADRL